jgi:hypothetical protein
MSLQSWQPEGWLRPHRVGPGEVTAILALADRDLEQSQIPGLSADWQLGTAYNAALQCARAALAACGYRVRRRPGQHYWTIRSLEFTIGLDAATVDVLDGFRRKRHAAEYERPGCVSVGEANQMLAMARTLRADVQAWLAAHHPALL